MEHDIEIKETDGVRKASSSTDLTLAVWQNLATFPLTRLEAICVGDHDA